MFINYNFVLSVYSMILYNANGIKTKRRKLRENLHEGRKDRLSCVNFGKNYFVWDIVINIYLLCVTRLYTALPRFKLITPRYLCQYCFNTDLPLCVDITIPNLFSNASALIHLIPHVSIT